MNRVVSHEAWLRERTAFLKSEKEMQRSLDAFNQRRRELPWERVETEYRFVGADGEVAFARLFGRCSQLIVYHFMFGANWEAGCPSCSLWTDGFQGVLPHLEQRDVALATVSTAGFDRLSGFRERMGWQHNWYSAVGPEFGNDYHVSYTDAEIEKGETFYNYQTGHQYGSESPGLSVFVRNSDDQIFHTYSSYARGLEGVSLIYPMLDRVPKGRDEQQLAGPMAWIKLKDEYEGGARHRGWRGKP